MHTRWRWALFSLGSTVAAVGPLAILGGVNAGNPWLGLLFGGAWLVTGGAVAWRSSALGVRVTDEGIVSTSLDGRTTIPWCDVDAIDARRHRNLIFFHTAAPVVWLKRSRETLTGLSLLSLREAVPPRTEQFVAELQQALRAHRATCPICGARPKELTAAQGPVQRLLTRLRRRFRPGLPR